MKTVGRLEYKYFVPYEHLEPLRQRFLSNMEYDGFARRMESRRYTVRSIYLDTRKFDFYTEKIQGLRVRKKLRIRSYNHRDKDTKAFLEIKRKFDNVIYKERVIVGLEDVPLMWDGETPHPDSDEPEFQRQDVIDKFLLYISKQFLEPVVLVAYEREALQGFDDPRLRVTFDLNVRSYPYPELDDLFREEDLNPINNRCFVLEIKFNEWMPIWVRRVVHDFDLRRQSISKYCEGLDNWLYILDGKVNWKR